jgi:molybdopterin converting factor small subunit
LEVRLHITLEGVNRFCKKGKVEVTQGATIKEAVIKYFEENNILLDLDYMPEIMVMLNKTVATLDEVIFDGDVITLARSFSKNQVIPY